MQGPTPPQVHDLVRALLPFTTSRSCPGGLNTGAERGVGGGGGLDDAQRLEWHAAFREDVLECYVRGRWASLERPAAAREAWGSEHAPGSGAAVGLRPVDAALQLVHRAWSTLPPADGAPPLCRLPGLVGGVGLACGAEASPRLGGWGAESRQGRAGTGMRRGKRGDVAEERINWPSAAGGRIKGGFNPLVRRLRTWRPDPRQHRCLHRHVTGIRDTYVTGGARHRGCP